MWILRGRARGAGGGGVSLSPLPYIHTFGGYQNLKENEKSDIIEVN